MTRQALTAVTTITLIVSFAIVFGLGKLIGPPIPALPTIPSPLTVQQVPETQEPEPSTDGEPISPPENDGHPAHRHVPSDQPKRGIPHQGDQ